MLKVDQTSEEPNGIHDDIQQGSDLTADGVTLNEKKAVHWVRLGRGRPLVDLRVVFWICSVHLLERTLALANATRQLVDATVVGR